MRSLDRIVTRIFGASVSFQNAQTHELHGEFRGRGYLVRTSIRINEAKSSAFIPTPIVECLPSQKSTHFLCLSQIYSSLRKDFASFIWRIVASNFLSTSRVDFILPISCSSQSPAHFAHRSSSNPSFDISRKVVCYDRQIAKMAFRGDDSEIFGF